MAKSKRKRHGLKSNVGEDPGPDISLLSRPTATSVKGIRDVLKAFEEGTAEVNHLLSNECEIVYECRVCRSLYRSFLNFITHKRIYCQQQYTSGSPKASHFFNDTLDEDETLVVQDEPVRTTRQTNNSANANPEIVNASSSVTSVPKPKPVPRKNLTEILGLLSQKASNNNEGLKRIVNLDGYTEMVASSNSGASTAGFKGRMPRQHLLHLENLECTDVALKQTVTLGPDGKILQPDKMNSLNDDEDAEERSSSPQVDNNQNDMEVDLVCTKCTPNATFSSRKTFRHHLNSQHDPSRIAFVCPCCRRHFANSWSVHRHLKTVHGKSTDQLRKLRDQIQTVKRESQEDAPKPARQQVLKVEDIAKEKLERDSSKRTELELFERELKKCSGCNKKFDRLAAFNYHVRNCQKRHTILKSKTTRKGVLTVKSSSTRRNAHPVKISVDKTEVLECVASDSDSTIDPGVDEACVVPVLGFESRELRNNNVRPEQAVTKKIEIQLRRDYNKIATQVSSDVQAATIPDETSTNSQEIVRSRVEYVLQQDLLSQTTLIPIFIDAEQDILQLSEEEKMSCDEDSEMDPQDSVKPSQTDSNSMYSSSNGDKSEIFELATDQKEEEENNESSVSNSSSSSDDVSGKQMSQADKTERPSADARESSHDEAVIEMNTSSAEELVSDDCNSPVEDILTYHRLQHITMSNCVGATESNSHQKSILEEILTKDKEDATLTTISFSPTTSSVATHAQDDDITIILDQRKKPFKKRTSVTDWNGFEDGLKPVLPTGPKKKRLKGIDNILTKQVTILPHNGRSPTRDVSASSAMNFKVKGRKKLPKKRVFQELADKNVTLHDPRYCNVEMGDPKLEEAIDLATFHPSEVPLLKNCADEVVVTTPDLDLTLSSDIDDSEDIIEADTSRSPRNSKVDVDAEILKVIFEEEDISQSSYIRCKKGKIFLENGSFSLHSNNADKSEPRASSPELFTEVSPVQSPLTVESVTTNVEALLNLAKGKCEPQASSSEKSSSVVEAEEQSSFTSSSDVEHMRPSSAMGSDLRSFTPVFPEVRSSSAMETESHPLNAESERRRSTEARQSTSSGDYDHRKPSDLETETPTSSMESLLTRSRPVRNKAKAKNSDFIYDLSDKAVYDEERSAVRLKPTSKACQKQAEIAQMQQKEITSPSYNPHVKLIRSEDASRLSVGYLSQGSAVKPVPGSSKSILPGLTASATTRKSVRVVTKL